MDIKALLCIGIVFLGGGLLSYSVASENEQPEIRKEYGCFHDQPYEKTYYNGRLLRQGLKWNLTRWVPDPPEVPEPNSRGAVVTYSLTLTGSGSFYIDFDDDDFIGEETKDVIRQATESWNHVCGITLKEVSEGGDIQIGASTSGIGTAYTTSYLNTTLNKWYIVRSSIQLGTSKPWTREKLLLVVSHEVGHALGLGHTNLSDALMWPTTGSGQVAPTGDERWYSQALYGSALPSLAYDFSITAPVTLSITKASQIQTGTTSSPTYSGSPGDPGVGTGELTQDDVSYYVLERRDPDAEEFSVISANLVPSDNLPNADPVLTHSENGFSYQDNNFTKDGIYKYRIKPVHSSNGEDEYSSELKVKISLAGEPNNAPVFNSQPFASMNPAIVNYSVTFSADTSDPDDETVSLTWDWGDGTGTDTGDGPSHRFTEVGSYTVTVTASDEFGGVTSTTLTVQVDELGSGSGDNDSDGIVDSEDDDDDNDGIPDSEDDDLDGDGFSNTEELTLGTNPNEAKSSPFTTKKLVGNVIYGKTGKDKCMLQGTFANLPKDFSPDGLKAIVNVGGVQREVTLNKKGVGKSKTESFRVNIKQIAKKGVAPFRFTAKGTFADSWRDEGLDASQDLQNGFMTINISIKMGDYSYAAVVYPTINSKAEKRARFLYKQPKIPNNL